MGSMWAHDIRVKRRPECASVDESGSLAVGDAGMHHSADNTATVRHIIRITEATCSFRRPGLPKKMNGV
jgi:hypothetical protein